MALISELSGIRVGVPAAPSLLATVTVSIDTDGNADSNLRLLNLNFITSEAFFNLSCYETGQ
jgi:hypothetical protein